MAGAPIHTAFNWSGSGGRTPSMISSRIHHSTGNSGNNTRNQSKPWLEILPDTRFIVFHGTEHEAQSVKLQGIVRLHTPEPMSILKPKVRLEGKRKVSWLYLGGISAGEVTDKRVFWNQEQKLGIESAHKVKAGTLDWQFEFDLSPSMPESVEGLRETYIAYHLHASVSRPGWNAKDITAQEHIRIVRTLGQDSMEMTRSRINADIWANKISYSISIPTDAIVFGTSITADVELSPIKKGIRLGKIELRLLETVVKRIQASEVPDIRGDRQKTDELEVAKTDMDFPEHSRVVYEDESIDNPTMADEMYKFKATLPLPKSLNVCRQDVDNHSINITHRFKLLVNIHNPEGHVSQLVCRLPVKLFISPNLPVDERNEVSTNTTGITDVELNSTETVVTAPPQYGQHQLDQMYSDIDVSGFMSRAGSGPGTPAGLYAQSRRGSHENILSLNGLADGDMTALHGSAMPSLLHSRLANLQQDVHISNGFQSQSSSNHHSPSGGTSPAPGFADFSDHSPERAYRYTPPVRNGSYFPTNGSSAQSSAPLSRRTSGEEDTSGIHSQDYDLTDLSRVPSYGAALRTPGAVTPFLDGPPSYMEATSRPPSPVQRPTAAHVRHGEGHGSNLSSSLSSLNLNGSSRIPTTTSVGNGPVTTHSRSLNHDEDARLRMLRARS